MDNNQKANLGCGTLILIALIVLIFGNAGSGDVKAELQQLRQDISSLERTVDWQYHELKEIRQLLERHQALNDSGPED